MWRWPILAPPAPGRRRPTTEMQPDRTLARRRCRGGYFIHSTMWSGIDMIAQPSTRRPGYRLTFAGAGWIACFVLVVAATASQAQQGNRDYYRANETHDDAQALRNADLYHIGPAIDRMKGHNYPSALQDLQFILDLFPNHPQALALLSDLCDLQWRAPQCDIDSRFQVAIERNDKA